MECERQSQIEEFGSARLTDKEIIYKLADPASYIEELREGTWPVSFPTLSVTLSYGALVSAILSRAKRGLVRSRRIQDDLSRQQWADIFMMVAAMLARLPNGRYDIKPSKSFFATTIGSFVRMQPIAGWPGRIRKRRTFGRALPARYVGLEVS